MGGRFYDITLPLYNGMAVYPGDPPFESSPCRRIENGDGYNLSDLKLGSHTGTHADAPRHFFKDGLPVDRLALAHFMGPTSVFDLTGKKEIGAEDLKGLPIPGEGIVLLKTRSGGLDPGEAAGLTPGAARYLVEKQIRTVGIDVLSIEREDSGEVHSVLLGGGAVILEGLSLSDVPPGDYRLVALPLRIVGGDGSPVRAVLLEE